MIKSLLITVATGLIIGFASYTFFSGILATLLPAAVTLCLLYLSVFSEHIRLELDGEQLRYYQKGKLMGDYYLPHCATRYRVVSESGMLPSHDIDFYVVDLEDDPEREVHIDCSPIGYTKFMAMYHLIEEMSPNAVTKLETTKRS